MASPLDHRAPAPALAAASSSAAVGPRHRLSRASPPPWPPPPHLYDSGTWPPADEASHGAALGAADGLWGPLAEVQRYASMPAAATASSAACADWSDVFSDAASAPPPYPDHAPLPTGPHSAAAAAWLHVPSAECADLHSAKDSASVAGDGSDAAAPLSHVGDEDEDDDAVGGDDGGDSPSLHRGLGLNLVLFDDDVPPRRPTITRRMLRGDRCDVQGINWTALGTTRATARAERARWERRRLGRTRGIGGLPRAAAHTHQRLTPLADADEAFFAFRRTHTAHRVQVAHFQLRNLVARPSYHDVFYSTGAAVVRADAVSGAACARTVLDLAEHCPLYCRARDRGASASSGVGGGFITTLAASRDVVAAATLDGQYFYVGAHARLGAPPAHGAPTLAADSLINHIDIAPHDAAAADSGGAFALGAGAGAGVLSSSSPYAPSGAQPQLHLSCNDGHVRTVDCATNAVVRSASYGAAVNASATAPDGRLRLVVGDFAAPLLADARSGAALHALAPAAHHADHVFAAAWAPPACGPAPLCATASQDGRVLVHDVRRLARPLAAFATAAAPPRAVAFVPPPPGSGSSAPPLLVVAEQSDCVAAVDARAWHRRQALDVVGEIGGVAVDAASGELTVAVAGRCGGLVAFRRRDALADAGDGRGGSEWHVHDDDDDDNDDDYDDDMDDDDEACGRWFIGAGDDDD